LGGATPREGKKGAPPPLVTVNDVQKGKRGTGGGDGRWSTRLQREGNHKGGGKKEKKHRLLPRCGNPQKKRGKGRKERRVFRCQDKTHSEQGGKKGGKKKKKKKKAPASPLVGPQR